MAQTIHQTGVMPAEIQAQLLLLKCRCAVILLMIPSPRYYCKRTHNFTTIAWHQGLPKPDTFINSDAMLEGQQIADETTIASYWFDSNILSK